MIRYYLTTILTLCFLLSINFLSAQGAEEEAQDTVAAVVVEEETEKEKKKKRKKTSPKSVFERRQETAVTISKEHFPLRLDASKKQLFTANYIDIHLVIDAVVRVCTGIEFHDGCWYLSTALAKRSELDDREWIVSQQEIDCQRVEVKRGKGGASIYIKDFNKKHLVK